MGVSSAWAADLSSSGSLQASSPEADSAFGLELEIAGDLAVVGAPDAEVNEQISAGHVSVYRREQSGAWTFVSQLNAGSKAAEDALFGSGLNMDRQPEADTLVVGAWGEGGNTGAAYVYERRGEQREFSLFQRLAPAGIKEFDAFGVAAQVRGNVLIVSAPGDSEGKPESGACYVYTRSNDTAAWTQSQRLKSPIPQVTGDFGGAINLSHNLLVVGAPREDGPGTDLDDAGAAYVYERDTEGQWQLVTKLVAGQQQASAFFGQTIAQVGSQILIGAPGTLGKRNDAPVTGAGAVYVFNKGPNGWQQGQKFQLEQAAADSFLGHDMEATNHRVALGTFRSNLGNPVEGRAYVLERDGKTKTWSLAHTLVPNASKDDDELGFGVAVAITADQVWAGAPYAQVPVGRLPQQAGRVFTFEVNKEPVSAPVLPWAGLFGLGLGLSCLARRRTR